MLSDTIIFHSSTIMGPWKSWKNKWKHFHIANSSVSGFILHCHMNQQLNSVVCESDKSRETFRGSFSHQLHYDLLQYAFLLFQHLEDVYPLTFNYVSTETNMCLPNVQRICHELSIYKIMYIVLLRNLLSIFKMTVTMA